MKQKFVVWFSEVDKGDVATVGGKGANLGEMTKAGFPVPPGFAITVSAYDLFLEENNLRKAINDILKITDVNQPDQLKEASRKINKLITTSEIPKEVSNETFKSYKELSGR